MKKLDRTATVKNPPERFTGDVWLDMVVTPQEGDQRAIVGRVRFAPGARTAWHRHARGQFLHVLAGVALMGSRDGSVLRAVPGETLYCPPGEDHWHGATPDAFMEHLAISENADDPAESTVWFEHVSDAEHAAG
ncbi:(R)-mandelonitrile lyase [Luteimicrobium subarcticum]|uniref:Quercetin dioxygenase-like cupin family protein n=1 Tax=Luteimicrobium subarcticum TaxID=620910 RepID=A0A2M8WJU5_9MICO|nr:cupin domain-containing protein [Luteimicrobium subarcticum]PJI91166.1 quercetin dioxygenase-like cupin family protein [Luteimicrobium subarcticum]